MFSSKDHTSTDPLSTDDRRDNIRSDEVEEEDVLRAGDEDHTATDELSTPDDDVELAGDQVLPGDQRGLPVNHKQLKSPHSGFSVQVRKSKNGGVLGFSEFVDEAVTHWYLETH